MSLESGLSQAAAIAAGHTDDFLRGRLASRYSDVPCLADKLFQSLEYSVFSGGKRFRPQVAFATAEALGIGVDRVTPFAAAVELIHTYSLIHDDLPCMDNDDWRRGQPTNHVIYGEATALLAGDALLTEAMNIVADEYQTVPEIGLELVRLLTIASGLTGMIGGQEIDIYFQNHPLEISKMNNDMLKKVMGKMHALKTGALIRVAAEGVAVIARENAQQRNQYRSLGENLGQAFQLTDDLLDHQELVAKNESAESSGWPKYFGVKETEALLRHVTSESIRILDSAAPKARLLRELFNYNLARLK